jgi:FG-GAP repeat
VAILHDPNPATGDHFGASVAIEGILALIGRAGNEIEGGSAGSAHLFIPGWGLAEATDFGGNWVNGSRAYLGYETPRYPSYWAGQSAVSLDGDAAEGRMGGWNGTSTWMETKVTGPATLYFSYLLKGAGGVFEGGFGVSSTGVGKELGTWGPWGGTVHHVAKLSAERVHSSLRGRSVLLSPTLTDLHQGAAALARIRERFRPLPRGGRVAALDGCEPPSGIVRGCPDGRGCARSAAPTARGGLAAPLHTRSTFAARLR